MNLKKIKDGLTVDIQDPTLEEQYMTMYDEDLLKDIIFSAFPDAVEDVSVNDDLTVDIKLSRPLTSDEASQLVSLGFDANLDIQNKTGWIKVNYNPVNYNFVEN